jgi:hypothetical protein
MDFLRAFILNQVLFQRMECCRADQDLTEVKAEPWLRDFFGA